MPVVAEIPGRGRLELEHVLFDVNGTLTNRGRLIDGVAERLAAVAASLGVLLVSADTFGTLEQVAGELGVPARSAGSGEEKLAILRELGAGRSAVVGNGSNDAAVLEAAALGIAVVGPEGASAGALRAADVVCASIHDALELLVDVRALRATLRA